MLARHEPSDTQPLVAPLATSRSLESSPPGTIADTISPSSSSASAPTPYKRELFVGINSPMAAAFCFSTIAIMPSISASFDFGLANGGPSTMVWGFLIASGFTIATTASLAEICSVYPGAGSAYYWTGNLAPSAWAPVMSFYCGFLSVIGNLAFLASLAYSWANFLVATLSAIQNDLTPYRPATLVIFSLLVLFLWTVTNVTRIESLGRFNNISAVFQILSAIVIGIVVVALAPAHPSLACVTNSFINLTGLEMIETNNAWVSMTGILFALYSFAGYEGSSHIAEETIDAETATPKGMLYGVVASAVVGLIYILLLLSSTPNHLCVMAPDTYTLSADTCTDSVQRLANNQCFASLFADRTNNATTICAPSSSDLKLPHCATSTVFTSSSVVNIFFQTAGRSGGLFLACALLVCVTFAGHSAFTVCSRCIYAIGRDGALPRQLARINSMSQLPTNAIGAVFVATSLLSLLPLLAPKAFTAILGLATMGLQLSYALPILMKLLHPNAWQPGAFNFGQFSFAIDSISLSWLVSTSLLFFWPTAFPVTAANMNWSGVLLAIFLILATVQWHTRTKRFYRGPLRSAAVARNGGEGGGNGGSSHAGGSGGGGTDSASANTTLTAGARAPHTVA